jgi:hypothetical protein
MLSAAISAEKTKICDRAARISCNPINQTDAYRGDALILPVRSAEPPHSVPSSGAGSKANRRTRREEGVSKHLARNSIVDLKGTAALTEPCLTCHRGCLPRYRNISTCCHISPLEECVKPGIWHVKTRWKCPILSSLEMAPSFRL